MSPELTALLRSAQEQQPWRDHHLLKVLAGRQAHATYRLLSAFTTDNLAEQNPAPFHTSLCSLACVFQTSEKVETVYLTTEPCDQQQQPMGDEPQVAKPPTNPPPPPPGACMMHADDDVTEGWADELQAQRVDDDDDDEDEDISDSEDDASDASEDAISVVARLAVDEATDAAIRQSQSSPCASWANASDDANDVVISPEAGSLPRQSDQSDSDEDEEAWPDCPRPTTSLSTNQTPSDQSGDDDNDEAEVTSWNHTTLTCPSALSPALQPWAPPLTAPADCLNCVVVSIVLIDSCFLSL